MSDKLNLNDLLDMGEYRRVQLVRDTSKFPMRPTENSTGFDCYADYESVSSLTIYPGKRALVPLGFIIEGLAGDDIQLRSRAGCSLARGLIILNAPATIDYDYRKEVCAMVYNSSQEPQVIKEGDPICQMIIAPFHLDVQLELVDYIQPYTRPALTGSGYTTKKPEVEPSPTQTTEEIPSAMEFQDFWGV